MNRNIKKKRRERHGNEESILQTQELIDGEEKKVVIEREKTIRERKRKT